jgi:hypothetical protein
MKSHQLSEGKLDVRGWPSGQWLERTTHGDEISLNI